MGSPGVTRVVPGDRIQPLLGVIPPVAWLGCFPTSGVGRDLASVRKLVTGEEAPANWRFMQTSVARRAARAQYTVLMSVNAHRLSPTVLSSMCSGAGCVPRPRRIVDRSDDNPTRVDTEPPRADPALSRIPNNLFTCIRARAWHDRDCSGRNSRRRDVRFGMLLSSHQALIALLHSLSNLGKMPASLNRIEITNTFLIYARKTFNLGVPSATRTRPNSAERPSGSSGLARLPDLPQPR